jgi:methyl-accepting chemotaxis protein
MIEATSKRRGLTIFTKTFLTTLIVALIPVLALGVRNVINEKSQTAARVDREFEQEAKLVAANVVGWIDGNLRLLRQNALLPDIRSADGARQRPVLHAMINTLPWSFLAFTIDSDGKNLGRSDTEELKDYSDREYFRAVAAGKDVGWQTVISKTSGKPTLVLAVPYQANGGTVGALATSSHLSEIAEAVTAARLGRTGFAFLLDGNGRVVAHVAPEFQGKLVDLSKHPAFQATRSTSSARVVFEENGKQYVAYALVIRLGWVVVVQQEVAEAFAPVDAATRGAIQAVGIVAILALLASSLLARALTRPILRLTAAADAISRGDTSMSIVEVQRGDEIGGLARAIDRMRVSIEVAIKRLRQARDLTKQ